jgi:integrase
MAAAFQRGLVRLYDRHGHAHRRSLGASERPELMPALEGWAAGLRAQKRWDLLDALIARRITVLEAFLAEMNGTLPQVLAALTAAMSAAAETDLDPLVDALVEDAKYRTQIRRLIPAGARFPVSRFTTPVIAGFLRTLTNARYPNGDVRASAQTRDRYRAALSHFAQRLVEEGHLTTNPVRDIAGAKKPLRRIRFLEPDQVRRLVDALPAPYRALEALLAGTGMEISAALRVRRRDVDPATRIVFAQGEKNEYRTRYVAVSEPWAWAIVEAHMKALAPNALLFPGITATQALLAHRRASEAQQLPRTTLHQHRHSFAVMHLQRGTDPQWIKNQLGHAPQSTLLYTTYGVFINAAKLTKAQAARLGQPDESAAPVTASVTASEK